MQYRRSKTPGAAYFFTVVTHQRQRIFAAEERVALLRDCFRMVQARHPFRFDAIAILPDHLHCVWTLPEGEADFSVRWRLIKGEFSRRCPGQFRGVQSRSRLRKGEQAVWQRRFWEHEIRGDQDFANHVDYIHYNPVRHGYVAAPKDWPYSSFLRYVRDGCYPLDWGVGERLEFDTDVGNE